MGICGHYNVTMGQICNKSIHVNANILHNKYRLKHYFQSKVLLSDQTNFFKYIKRFPVYHKHIQLYKDFKEWVY